MLPMLLFLGLAIAVGYIPCLMAVASTQQESHSLKWTFRIVGYYLAVALLMATIAFHIGRLIF
jgi:ferrous iron transport protein B